MLADDVATADEPFRYRRDMKKRYVDAGRKERETSGWLRRTSLVRLNSGILKHRPRRPAVGCVTGLQALTCIFRDLRVR